MYSSDSMAKKTRLVAQNIKLQFLKVSCYAQSGATEITPLFMRSELLSNGKYDCSNSLGAEEVKLSGEYDKFDHHDDGATSPWKLPLESNILLHIVRWPITLTLWCSIPDCRRHGNFYVLTFVNCVAWILALSYLIASMITNVGEY
jgi:hypothetical protein